MKATYWTLAQTLQRRGITTHALIKANGLSKGTVYDIVNGKSRGITLETNAQSELP
ncbi:helix-turn-helix domain-containing protein [Deinococcus fonticola]|uniref:helix-turn-helix domain-containing protein n=1 Tax=Deinococcus fonticola TaxID=2528713 RepID=UPI001074D993|nr:helix-turn-helix transcriptional regulator [Deinococcus fonticola]